MNKNTIKSLAERQLAIVMELTQGGQFRHGDAAPSVNNWGGELILATGETVVISHQEAADILTAGVPLHTFENKVLGGWSTKIPLPKRFDVQQIVKEVLAEAAEAGSPRVIVNLAAEMATAEVSSADAPQAAQ